MVMGRVGAVDGGFLMPAIMMVIVMAGMIADDTLRLANVILFYTVLTVHVGVARPVVDTVAQVDGTAPMEIVDGSIILILPADDSASDVVIVNVYAVIALTTLDVTLTDAVNVLALAVRDAVPAILRYRLR